MALLSHRAMGNLQQALVCFEKRLVVAHELGEAFDKAQAYGELGTLHGQLGNFEQAISCLERQLGIARDMKDQALEGNAACGLGSVYQQMAEYDTALQYHQMDLQIAEETNNPACQGRAYGNLGLTYESLGTYERAMVYQEQHLSIAAQMNDLAAKTASYSSLGRTHHALQNYSQAVMYLQEGQLACSRQDMAPWANASPWTGTSQSQGSPGGALPWSALGGLGRAKPEFSSVVVMGKLSPLMGEAGEERKGILCCLAQESGGPSDSPRPFLLQG